MESIARLNGYLNIPLALTATIGNALVLAAIWKTPSLHCATNVLIFSLALSDLGVGLITQPLWISSELSFVRPEYYRLFIKVPLFQMISGSLCGVSLLTVTLIGVDRYLAVKLHLRYKEFITTQRTACAVVVIWVVSISAMAATFLISARFQQVFEIIVSPVIIACLFINISVYQKLYRLCRFHHTKIQDQTGFQRNSSLYQRAVNEARFRKSVKTMFFIVLAFTLCYSPFFCTNVAIIIKSRPSLVTSISKYTTTLVFANSSVNPALVIFQLTELRLAVKQILKQAIDH